MKYVIWGAGHRGEIIYKILGDKYISCFIDSNIEKQKNGFCGKDVISYNEYKSSFRHEMVIVSPVLSSDIVEQLDNDNISYFFLDECPSEFMGYGIQTAKKYLNRLLDSVENHSALYGVTLYSIWLYNLLKQQGKNDISFIAQKNLHSSLKEKLISEYNDLRIIDIAQAENENRKINVCLYDDQLNDDNIHDSYFDIFDLSKNIVPYRNERIAAFKNKYAGKRCFIVATGPSLKMEDLETLRKNEEFCISMNSIFYAFDKTEWRPDVYAILDGMAMDKWKDILLNFNLKNIFLGDSCIHINYDELPENYYIYHTLAGRYVLQNPKISEDFSIKTYNSGTITYICIQLAIFLGFKEIYLLGVDFNYTPGANNHFQKEKNEYVMTASVIKDANECVLRGYQAAKQYVDSHGIKIYNATRGGQLEVFPRVDFDTLFN